MSGHYGFSSRLALLCIIGALVCGLAAVVLAIVAINIDSHPRIYHRQQHTICWDVHDNYGPVAMVNCQNDPSNYIIKSK